MVADAGNKKMFYVVFACIIFAFAVIGGTYAYFTATASDNTTVNGNSATVSFGLRVSKVTDIDNAFGLVPMKNDQAPNAALMKCKDDYGNAGCQIYQITVTADSNTVMFLDGYVIITPKDGVETRFASVYKDIIDKDTDNEKEVFNTKFSSNDFVDRDNLSSSYLSGDHDGDVGIKSGLCEHSDTYSYNNTNAFDCLFVSNQKIGGDVGIEKIYYLMVWVYDNGRSQDAIQGLDLAYQGEVVFTTADGNEITATFD